MSKGIHLILLGAPGVGKGTQSALLKDKLSAAHVSTGEILRAAVRNGTEMGLSAKTFMDKGELVPDSVILGIIKDTLSDSSFPDNWMMDGFPRNLAQAEAFNQLLSDIDQSLTVVLNIAVPFELLMERLTLRRTCRKTGQVFNLKLNPPPEDGDFDLFQRADDTEEAVNKRLSVYDEQTKPLIEYYSSKGLLANINGDQPMDDVLKEILTTIDKFQ